VAAPIRIGIAIPTYNERENIIPLLEAAHSFVPGAHLLVIDDSSPDGTATLVAEFAQRNPHVEVKVRPRKEGLGAAYVDGFGHLLAAGYDVVLQMDADFSHKPENLPRFVETLAAGADLVIGSRYVPGGGTENWGWRRKLTSRGGSIYAATVLGVPVKDVTGGFKGWRATLLRRVIAKELLLKGFGFQIELTYRARLLGANIREIPIVFPDRTRGASKMSGAIFREAFFGVLRLRRMGRRLVSCWGDELLL